MKKLPRISDAEWSVMKLLWKESPLTASEIIAALKTNLDWNAKTIHTLISRLIKKGAVKAEKAQPFYLYSSCVSEEECRREETKSFIQKVYDGSLNMLVASFLKNENLSDAEIEELQRILDLKRE